jgi:hypothetical protein
VQLIDIRFAKFALAHIRDVSEPQRNTSMKEGLSNKECGRAAAS